MGIFNFFKKNSKGGLSNSNKDLSGWTGKDFEFLISGEIEIPADKYDEIMTPNSLEWKKNLKNEWPHYQVGHDSYSYSYEMPGIQMTFNEEVSYLKAKTIADEVIKNIESLGQYPKLILIEKNTLTSF